jgi:hypothetical protein
MFHHNQHSFLDNVLTAEKEQFQQSVVETFVTTQNTDHFFEGNVLYKIPFKRSSVTTLLSDYNTICFEPKEKTNNRSAQELLRRVSKEFLNIQAEAPFQECMQIIHPYQINAGKHFYGALLRSTTNPDIIINPFHILTAVSVLSSEYVNHKFNILLYFYTDRNEADNRFNTHKTQADKIDNNLNALMQSFTSKLDTELKVDVVHQAKDGDNIHVVHKERKYKDEGTEKTHFIVAHQLLTRGIIAPYYGTSLIQWDNFRTSCVGTSLSPFNSVNISGYVYIFTTNDENNSMASVCTGHATSTTLHGLRTLTHANLGSPYQEYAVRPGALAYADAMVKKATLLYINAGVITPYVKTDPMKDFTEKELACSTLLEFVKLRKKDDKKQIPLVELKAQYTAMLALNPIEAPIKTPITAIPPKESEIRPTLIHLDGTPVTTGDRFVYKNRKSGRRISSTFIAVEDSILISRDLATNRLLRHNMANVEQQNSIIAANVRVFVGDHITYHHSYDDDGDDGETTINNIRHTAIPAFNYGVIHIRNLSNIIIRNT